MAFLRRFRESLWSNKPVLHLGTQPAPDHDRKSIDAWPVWNYEPGRLVRVLCYTKAAKARLLLDGKPVGEEKPYDPATGVISWDIPFTAGNLEAIGVDAGGSETCRALLQSADSPAAMKLAAGETVIDRRRGVAMIALQIVDRNGVPVMDAGHEVTCSVEGPARLLGLEAGNTRDMSDYSDAVHSVFRGRIVAYIQATGDEGAVSVRFTTAGLPAAAVTLTAR